MNVLESYHTLTPAETLKKLNTSEEGLTQEEAAKRIHLYGRNVLKEEKTSKWRIFFRQFNNLIVYVLLAASLISISVGKLADFFFINFIIFFNGALGFWQEMKAEATIAALKKMTESRCKVMRGGELILMSSSELAIGDYLVFHEGEIVTADVRLIDSEGLMVDESAITGESGPILKDHEVVLPKEALPYELKNTLLTGTTILRGTGHGVVVKSGANSYFASIAEKAQEETPKTPLTKALNFFATWYIVLLFVVFSLLAVYGYFQGRTIIELSYILLASLVSAVPEGLPIVITLVMVIGATALSKRQALVRYLPSVETMGSATVIASDKTGTITEGKLIVKEFYSHDVEKLKLIASLCNDSHEGSGDPLDVALWDWIGDLEPIRDRYPRLWAYSFDAALMLMATVHEFNGKKELLVKGAYESLREKATNSAEEIAEIEKVMNQYLDEGLRVLAFGMGDWVEEDPEKWKIRIIGLIGFFDPPKEGVKEAVSFAKNAGIHVIMITGDHPKTAKAVAKAVNIWTEGDHILTGSEIEEFSDERLLEELKVTMVLARILPEHKYRIVKLLQMEKEIVAMTGDGVNDVPALRAADIGIAMGSGTEAAKNVSEMVITDNNLKVIIDAIQNARIISDNIRKVIYFLISTSLQEIILISLAIITFLPLPLPAIQILWINIIAGGILDKAFPFAKGEGNVMARKPRRPERQFFDLKQIIRLLVFGVGTGIICYFLYIFLLEKYEYKVVSTLLFTSIIMAQWANGVQAQKDEEPFFKNIKNSFCVNPSIFLGLAIGIALQAFVIYLVPSWLEAVRIPSELLIYPALIFAASFFLVEIRKWVEYAISFARK
jgi:P-type Ca2+ transporter type 2C